MSSLVAATGVILTTEVVSFLTDSTGLTAGVSTFLTVSVFLVSVVLTTGAAGLTSLFSVLAASVFTGVTLAGSALTTSFLTSSFLGATANEVANRFTGCAALVSVLTFKVVVWTGVLTSAAFFASTVAVLTGAAGA